MRIHKVFRDRGGPLGARVLGRVRRCQRERSPVKPPTSPVPMTLAPSGQIAFVGHGGQLEVMNADGSDVRTLTAGRGSDPALVAGRREARLHRRFANLLDERRLRQRRALDALAPSHVVVPTGSRIPIDYSDPLAPKVAVRLQEVFGLAESGHPRAAVDGRRHGTVVVTGRQRESRSSCSSGWFDSSGVVAAGRHLPAGLNGAFPRRALLRINARRRGAPATSSLRNARRCEREVQASPTSH
jgi:hypothetical protein